MYPQGPAEIITTIMRAERFINSLDFQYLTNTIELDLSNIFGKGMFPSRREIHSFITDELKVTAAMLAGVQHHPRFPKVHIMFEKEEDMIAVELRLKDGLKMANKNLKIFGYRCDNPMVTITVNGQAMKIEKDEIVRVMEKYGKVVTCERGRNHDLSTRDKFVSDGTWTVRMNPKLNTKPPETIYYFGEMGLVQTWILNYDGVGSSCVLCGQQGHMGFRCTSIVPKGGKMGLCPAGLGEWTDVVSAPEPVEVGGGQGDDQVVQPVVGPGELPVPQHQAAAVGVDRNVLSQQLAGAEGVTASQPAITGGGMVSGNVRDVQNKHLASVKHLQGIVDKEGWGRRVIVNNVAGTSGTRVKAKPDLPGLNFAEKDAEGWVESKRSKKRKKQRQAKKIPLKDDNRFNNLEDDDSGDKDKELKPKALLNQFRLKKQSSAMAAYGCGSGMVLVRKPLNTVMKKKTKKPSMKINPNANKKHKPDGGLVPGGTLAPVDIMSQGSGEGAGRKVGVDETGGVSEQNDLDKPMEETEAADESLEKVDTKQVDIKVVPSVDFNSLPNLPKAEAEDQEIKEAAAKIRAKMDAYKNKVDATSS